MRSVFIVGPDKCIKLMLIYSMTTGCNFDETLRVLDSVSDDHAKKMFLSGWKAPKPYLRITKQPG